MRTYPFAVNGNRADKLAFIETLLALGWNPCKSAVGEDVTTKMVMDGGWITATHESAVEKIFFNFAPYSDNKIHIYELPKDYHEAVNAFKNLCGQNDGCCPSHADLSEEGQDDVDIERESVRRIAKEMFDIHKPFVRDVQYNAIAWHVWKRAFDAAASIFRKNNDAEEFAEWLHCNQFVRYITSKEGAVPYGDNKDSKKNIWVSTKIHYGSKSEYFTTADLYKIFSKRDNK